MSKTVSVVKKIFQAQQTFKPIDTAFAILFLLLIAFAALHVTTVSDMAGSGPSASLQIAHQLEKFRALDHDLSRIGEITERQDMEAATKVVLLDMELMHLENALRELGTTAPKVLGLTRLVEPAIQIRQARTNIKSQGADAAAVTAEGTELHRALQGAQFIIRNNITRLGDELTEVTASMNGFNDRAREIGIFGALIAVAVFWPVRFMARRQAAKPIKALKAATRAVAEERWQVTSIDFESEDAVGELVVAFHTMASKLQESRQHRITAFQGSLASLVHTLEAKDEYTFNHSYHVSKFSELLARDLELPEAEIREIVSSGMLHDIGKIGIPDGIINKPSKLTSEEFKEIQEHPVIGGRIVEPLDGSEQLLPPVIHHHERWDGTGYPHGLRGEDIPLTARIVAVADVFEALRSDRPYRDRLSEEEAITILREEAGKTLDPRLVELFITQVIPKIHEAFPHFSDVKPAEQSEAPESSDDGALQSLDA